MEGGEFRTIPETAEPVSGSWENQGQLWLVALLLGDMGDWSPL